MAFQITDQRACAKLVGLLLNEPNSFVYCIDVRTQRLVFASRGCQRLFGRSSDALCAPDAPLITELLTDVSDVEDTGGAAATLGRTVAVRHADGTRRWLATREVVYETDSSGQITHMLGYGRDITRGMETASGFGRHKSLLRNLNRIVEQFSTLPAEGDVSASIDDGLALLGGILDARRCHLCRFHGRDSLPVKVTMTNEFHAPDLQPLSDTISHLPVNLYPWFYAQMNAGNRVQLSASASPPESDRLLHRMLSHDRTVSYIALPLVHGAERWGYVGIVPNESTVHQLDDDVFGLLQLMGQVFVNRANYASASREQIESEIRWRRTVDAAFDMVLVLDRDSNVVDASSQRSQIELSKYIGEHVSALVNDSSFRKLRNAISNALSHEDDIVGGARDVEVEAVGPNGGHIWYRARVSPRRRTGVVDGVTVFATVIHNEKQAAERISELNKELEHASRLSVLGQMATEIAHELNQPLQVISSYAEGLRMRLDSLGEHDLTDVTRYITQAADDAAQTVKNIREFVHHRVVEVRFAHFSEIVETTLALADITIREHDAVIETDIPDELPPVLVNPAQIHHVLLNLIVNGIEAATADILLERIRIHIECHLDDDVSRLVVTVRDNGPGVPVEKRDAIFERYVTTKKTGLGVGLASSRDVIERYGGTLSLLPADKKNGGAVFRFTLPLASQSSPIESDTSER